MIGKSLLAGVAAAMLVSAASAQTPNPAAPPSDQATQPMTSTTPSGTPYSDSGSGLPQDPSDMPRSNTAAQHASDSAAQTSDSDAKRIEQCKSMPNDQMMKNSNCAALAKKHPTMMNGGSSQPQ